MEQPNIVAYSPNDFFWKSVKDEIYAPISSECVDLQINNPSWDTSCNALHISDNSLNCFQVAYCKNKNYATTIANQQSSHSAADGRYTDTQSDYFLKLQTSINLGIGIAGVGMFIYMNK